MRQPKLWAFLTGSILFAVGFILLILSPLIILDPRTGQIAVIVLGGMMAFGFVLGYWSVLGAAGTTFFFGGIFLVGQAAMVPQIYGLSYLSVLSFLGIIPGGWLIAKGGIHWEMVKPVQAEDSEDMPHEV